MLSLFRLRNLKVWQKLALIVAVMSSAVPVIFYLISTRDAATIDFAQNERYGNEYLRPARSLYARAVGYRDLVSAAMGRQSFGPELGSLSGAIEQDLAEIEKVHSARGTLLAQNVDRVPPRLRAMKEAWAKLKTLPSQPGPDTTDHLTFVNEVAAFITQIGDSSNLILDPDIDTYYLMSSIITSLPPLADDLGTARSLAATAAGRQVLTVDERLRLAALLGRIQLVMDTTRKGMIDSAFPYNPSLDPIVRPEIDALTKSIEEFRRLTDAQLRADLVSTSPKDVYEAGGRAIDQVFKLYTLQLDQLDRLIEVRIGKFAADRLYIWIGVVVGTLLAFVLTVVIARTITRQINDVVGVFNKLGMGDLKARAATIASDELGLLARSLNATLDNLTGLMQSRAERDQMQQSIMKLLDEVGSVGTGDLTVEAEVTADMTGAIADSYNQMIGQLRQVIGDVQGATARVSLSAQQLEGTTTGLAEGTEAQATKIVTAAAAIEEMATSIAHVSDNAASSAAVAEQARSNAEQGAQAVSRTIAGMNSIRDQVQETAKRIKRLGESSQEIGEIVQVIGDIADRTSILALNASIQAAMAGEAGRGFAVVAGEVERLAERASDATKRIGTLIKTTQSETAEAVAAMEETTKEVVSGSSVANEAGSALGEIRTVSDRLAALIQSISDASHQQARASEHVAKTMSDISVNTRATAAETRTTAQSIGSLAGLANELRGSMSHFKLPSASNGQHAARQ